MIIPIPKMCKIERQLPAGQPVAIEATLQAEWQRLALADEVRGKRIALGVGSRGVANIIEIAREIVRLIRESGGDPFIVPAMGSHGRALAEGQIEMLEGLGITEASMDCPIKATMETVITGTTPEGHPAHIDRNVFEADGYMLVNRVKIHTDFHHHHESGMVKMLAIGLGKENGAQYIHNAGTHGLREHIPAIARYQLANTKFIAGFGTVEDGYHRPVILQGFRADQVMSGELHLIAEARRLMPRLPIDDIDVLIIDRMGKDISGAGMDTNVIGRLWIKGDPEPEAPRVKVITIHDLTEASHGNAVGIGLADFTVRRLLDKIDFPQLTKNAFTSGFLERGRLPIVYETDEETITAAIHHAYRATPGNAHMARVIRIVDTLTLDCVWASENIIDEIRASEGFQSAGAPELLHFTNGHLF